MKLCEVRSPTLRTFHLTCSMFSCVYKVCVGSLYSRQHQSHQSYPVQYTPPTPPLPLSLIPLQKLTSLTLIFNLNHLSILGLQSPKILHPSPSSPIYTASHGSTIGSLPPRPLSFVQPHTIPNLVSPLPHPSFGSAWSVLRLLQLRPPGTIRRSERANVQSSFAGRLVAVLQRRECQQSEIVTGALRHRQS